MEVVLIGLGDQLNIKYKERRMGALSRFQAHVTEKVKSVLKDRVKMVIVKYYFDNRMS